MRKSGIELLRILAACAVVILHYREMASDMDGSTANMITLDFIGSFAICAVNVFVAISGYFMIKSQKRVWGKALSLLFQVSLINVGLYFVSVVSGNTVFSWLSFVENLIPHNYFVILYVVMYFFTPYINVLINGMTNESRKRFMIISLLLFSLWPTIVNVSEVFLGIKWFGLSSISAWGSQQGFTIVNFLLLYSTGACLRLETFKISRSLLSIIACGCLIFVWVIIEEHLGTASTKTAWEYHNPFVIMLAIWLLKYFEGYTFQSKIINKMAKSAFFCYLIHYYILAHLKVDYFITQPVYILLLHLLGSIVVIYLISWVGFWMYNKMVGPIFNKLDKFEIAY